MFGTLHAEEAPDALLSSSWQDAWQQSFPGAMALYDRGKFTEASKAMAPATQLLLATAASDSWISQVLADRKGLTDAYFNLGNFAYKSGDLKAALYYYLTGFSMKPDDQQLLANLTLTLKALGTDPSVLKLPDLTPTGQLNQKGLLSISTIQRWALPTKIWLWVLLILSLLILITLSFITLRPSQKFPRGIFYALVTLTFMVVVTITTGLVIKGQHPVVFDVIYSQQALYSTPGTARVELLSLPPGTIVIQDALEAVVTPVTQDSATSPDLLNQTSIKVHVFTSGLEGSHLGELEIVPGWIPASSLMSYQLKF